MGFTSRREILSGRDGSTEILECKRDVRCAQGPVKVVEGQGEKNGQPVVEKQRPEPAARPARLNLVPGSELLEARC